MMYNQAMINKNILDRELFIKKISSVLLLNDQVNKTKKSNTSNEVRAISSFGGNTSNFVRAISSFGGNTSNFVRAISLEFKVIH